MLLGLFIGENRQIICQAEVPYSYFSNNQVDMLLLDVRNKEYLCIEYKLANHHDLMLQIRLHYGRGFPAIGIINNKPRETNRWIFGYTGRDCEIEKLAKDLVYYKHNEFWRSIYQGPGMIYYWAYKDMKTNFDGGITGGNRENFASVYQRAIVNLHEKYHCLDFMLAHAALHSGYSVGTSKKYYKKAVTGHE